MSEVGLYSVMKNGFTEEAVGGGRAEEGVEGVLLDTPPPLLLLFRLVVCPPESG